MTCSRCSGNCNPCTRGGLPVEIPRGKAGIATTSRRPRRNFAEGLCFDLLRAEGWEVTKRGWPDFFAWKPETGEVRIVEVKRKPEHGLRAHQVLVANALRRAGFRFELFDPISGTRRELEIAPPGNERGTTGGESSSGEESGE